MKNISLPTVSLLLKYFLYSKVVDHQNNFLWLSVSALLYCNFNFQEELCFDGSLGEEVDIVIEMGKLHSVKKREQDRIK